MKKFTTIFKTMLIAFAGIFTLSSCEDDAQEVAYTMEGSWTGYIDTYFEDRWGWSSDEYRVTFTFIRNGDYDYDSSTSGRGIETGYNLNDRYHDYYQSRFTWYVDNSYHNSPTITIVYDDDRYNPVYIYDYRISNSRFIGYMDDGTNRDIKFDLRYDGNFNYSGWRGAPTRSADNDSVKVTDNGKSIRSGIFAEITPNSTLNTPN